MEMNLARLRLVVAVADEGSFSAAGRAMHIAQPSVSRAVAELERHAGVQVFRRASHSAHLTLEGEAIVQECRRLLDAADRFWGRTREVAAGELMHVEIEAMHSLATLVLPRALHRYRQEHPGFSFVVSDRFAGDILRDMTANDHRLALTAVPPNFRASATEGLHFTDLMRDAFVLITAPGATSGGIGWDEIGALDFILAAPESNTGRFTSHIFETQGIAPKVIARLLNISAVGGMVASGIGAAIVPTSTLPLMAFAALDVRPLPDRYERRIGAFQSAATIDSAGYAALIESLRHECSAFALDVAGQR